MALGYETCRFFLNVLLLGVVRFRFYRRRTGIEGRERLLARSSVPEDFLHCLVDIEKLVDSSSRIVDRHIVLLSLAHKRLDQEFIVVGQDQHSAVEEVTKAVKSLGSWLCFV